MKINAETILKLGCMFFKMKTSKQRIEKKRIAYANLCKLFLDKLQEQAKIIEGLSEKFEQNTSNPLQKKYLCALRRISYLLYKNANLQYRFEEADERYDCLNTITNGMQIKSCNYGTKDLPPIVKKVCILNSPLLQRSAHI